MVYRRELPRIAYGNDNHAFLVEGVIATIEVKSVLTQRDIEQACKASVTHRSLTRAGSLRFVMQGQPAPENMLTYAVAFGGPANMSTVAQWLEAAAQTSRSDSEKCLDLVAILGKGVVWRRASWPAFQMGGVPAQANWLYIETAADNLMLLFLHMLNWTRVLMQSVNLDPYAAQGVGALQATASGGL